MAHEILNNQIAYKGATPWHNLGFRVPENATGAEMLEIARLNWEVVSRNIALVTGDGAFNMDRVKPYRAITRADNNTVFQIASTLYKPVQNAEIVDFFREYCEAGHATMETVGALRGGAVVWALARLAGGADATLRGGDKLTGYMLLATSHDGSIPTVGHPTQVRVVCANTFRAASRGADKDRTFRLMHFQKFDGKVKEQAQKTMGMAIEQVHATNELAEQLSQVHIDANDRLEFLERVLLKGSVLEAVVEEHQPSGSVLDRIVNQTQGATREAREERLGKVGKAILEAIVNSPGSDMASAKDTLWGAFNGVTYYADHGARELQAGNRLYSSWFGQNENLKSKALEAAIEMSGARVALPAAV